MSKSELEKINKILSEKYSCYILITCQEPSEDGSMKVEMNYNGDASNILYLIESAQSFLEDDGQQEQKHECTNKILHI